MASFNAGSDSDGYIQLDRTFLDVDYRKDATDDDRQFVPLGNRIGWSNLLLEYRVVLLAEAGAGKTAEVRDAARRLEDDGKASFFLRLEDIGRTFENAFEVGRFERFQEWLLSPDEGWLFLDSVDESRLRDPRGFEDAIRVVGHRVGRKLQQTHIFVTSRQQAWRPISDRITCAQSLKYEGPDEKAVQATEGSNRILRRVRELHVASDPFKIVTLADLNEDQVGKYLRCRDVKHPEAFRRGVQKRDLFSLTTRPQDLSELVDFWLANGQLGSRIEMIRYSIERRLKERDPNREHFRDLPAQQLREGAAILAAACTLTRQASIRFPECPTETPGIALDDLLPGWLSKQRDVLLDRPLFDEGAYGTSRFHHVLVREYLTAEWLFGLLQKGASRPRVMQLFFRKRYGIDVVVPSMRRVLPWLCHLDGKCLEMTQRLAPEIFIEGGDPSQLPLELRRNILIQACKRLAVFDDYGSISDQNALERFASEDLAEDINILLVQHRKSDAVIDFLLRLTWIGEIHGSRKAVRVLAMDARRSYSRIYAVRALAVIGRESDRKKVREAALKAAGPIDREFLTELVPSLPATSKSCAWLLQAFRHLKPARHYATDGLAQSVGKLTAEWPSKLLLLFISGCAELLTVGPTEDFGDGPISKSNHWLLPIAASAVQHLLGLPGGGRSRLPVHFILLSLVRSEFYCAHDIRKSVESLKPKLLRHSSLRRAQFWYEIRQARARLKPDDRPITDHWRLFGEVRLWSFGAEDFPAICDDILRQKHPDDQLVALSLAFTLFSQNDRPSGWLRKLRGVSRKPVLAFKLKELLAPPKPNDDIVRMQQRWERDARVQKETQEKNRKKNLKWVGTHLTEIRSIKRPGKVNDAQAFLYENLRKTQEEKNKWAEGDWRALSTEFGHKVAEAFRDGAIAFWRTYRPQLPSEAEDPSSIPYPLVFGLLGLTTEARENSSLFSQLSKKEAQIAARYALLELNGYPSWMAALVEAQPQAVVAVIKKEINHELSLPKTEQRRYGSLYDLAVHGSFLWDRLKSFLIDCSQRQVANVWDVEDLLSMLVGSSLTNAEITEIAAKRVKDEHSQYVAPLWFAVWVGVDPVAAIPAVTRRLQRITTDAEQGEFAQRFAVALVGSRGNRVIGRGAFWSVGHVRSLFDLLHRYIRSDEDLNRANGGVYSPGLRDYAQEARDSLFTFLRNTPGADAYSAVLELAASHPDPSHRSWIAKLAFDKATLDSEEKEWSAVQVREFAERGLRLPRDHAELWSLAIDLLTELKFDIEEGDTSPARFLIGQDETAIRVFIANHYRNLEPVRFAVTQEEELVDKTRPDLRFLSSSFDAPVPVEIKIASRGHWRDVLFERLEEQLCAQYLRDRRSTRGIYLLFNDIDDVAARGWRSPDGSHILGFEALVKKLQDHWNGIRARYPNIDDISVIGIDLNRRGVSKGMRRRTNAVK